MFGILKKYMLLLLLVNFVFSASAQRNDPSHHNPAIRKSITAVLDTTDWKNLRSYYKLANGNRVGEDSVYSFDAMDDTESDGKIRFRDRITDKVGFFDNNGRVVVPALYNDANRFQNSMAMVIKDAKRVGWNGEDCEKANCEHWLWAGGSTMLINARGEVLVDQFEMKGNPVINWYSLQMKDVPGDTALYCSVKGVNGKWYVFMDYQKEFEKWFKEVYLEESGEMQKLRASAHDSLVSSLPEYPDWKRMSRDEFIKSQGRQLQGRLQPLRDQAIRYFAVMEGLNPYIHTGGSFEPFFDTSDAVEAGRYPAFDVISNIEDKNGRLDYQEHYSFLRTDHGYKLIGVSWRNP